MFMSSWPQRRPLTGLATLLLAVAACLVPAQAQPVAAAEAAGSALREALAAAWARHAESRSTPLRREALDAQRRLARAWTPGPAALEASTRSERLPRLQGARELEVGVAVPLWLPGERHRALAAADGELAALDSQSAAAQWQLAGAVREAWWALQLARQDVATATARRAGLLALAADVQRRVAAGDMARADQNQADAAVAAADAEVAQGQAAEALAAQGWRALVGPGVQTSVAAAAEAEPPAAAALPAQHPALRARADRVEALRLALALGQVQRRGNPELTVLTTRERGGAGEAAGQTVTLGVRVPLGSDDARRAKSAALAADLAEAEAALALEQDRLQADIDTLRSRVALARVALQASLRRAELTRQTQGFVDKSFRAGETALPARLRAEAEATEAERAAERARIELQRAISQWRQALGLLPG